MSVNDYSLREQKKFISMTTWPDDIDYFQTNPVIYLDFSDCEATNYLTMITYLKDKMSTLYLEHLQRLFPIGEETHSYYKLKDYLDVVEKTISTLDLSDSLRYLICACQKHLSSSESIRE